jgi:hypothetical protein
MVVRRFFKSTFHNTASGLLRRVIREDLPMLQQEQAAFFRHPTYKGPELNRALVGVQQLIRQQAAEGDE